MISKPLVIARSLCSLFMALSLALGWLLALPLDASAQGQWPRCPGAPFRFPSGNWIWQGYTVGYGGNHGGVDLVDRSLEYTTTASSPAGPNASSPYFEGTEPGPNLPAGHGYPEGVIPVYAPITGQFNDVGWNGPFPGSAFLSATLDPVFEGAVPTRNIRIWFAHMSNYSGTVMYITHPTGPINEGDLIGYQGQGNTFPVHLHFEIDSGHNSSIPQDPSNYLGLPLAGPSNTNQYYAIKCNQTPVGNMDQPAYNGSIHNQTTISGWLIDPPSSFGTGIDQVQLYVDGFKGSTGILLGNPTYGEARPDVAQQAGNQFLNSGYSFNWSLGGVSTGRHSLHLYAHQTSSNTWLLMDVRYVNVQPFIFSFFNFIPVVIR